MNSAEHVVFFPASDGSPAFRRLSSLHEAVDFVEHLRNEQEVAEVSVHSLAEVPLAFRTVYRVEVAGAVPAPPAPVEAAMPAPAPAPGGGPGRPPPPLAEPVAEPVAEMEPVAMAPVAEFVAEPVPVEAPVAEPEPVAASADGHSLGFFAGCPAPARLSGRAGDCGRLGSGRCPRSRRRPPLRNP